MRLSNKSQGGSCTRLRKQKIPVRYFPEKGDILLQEKEEPVLKMEEPWHFSEAKFYCRTWCPNTLVNFFLQVLIDSLTSWRRYLSTYLQHKGRSSMLILCSKFSPPILHLLSHIRMLWSFLFSVDSWSYGNFCCVMVIFLPVSLEWN